MCLIDLLQKLDSSRAAHTASSVASVPCVSRVGRGGSLVAELCGLIARLAIGLIAHLIIDLIVRLIIDLIVRIDFISVAEHKDTVAGHIGFERRGLEHYRLEHDGLAHQLVVGISEHGVFVFVEHTVSIVIRDGLEHARLDHHRLGHGLI